MSNLLIKRTGTNFEISNGTITIQGPNRAQLLSIMDSLESQPANISEIKKKVEKAAEVATAKKKTTKKVENKVKISGVQLVREYMKSSQGKVTAHDVSKATGLSVKYCLNYLWNLWKKGEIQSEEKGIYFK